MIDIYLLTFKLNNGDILTPDPLSLFEVKTIKKLPTERVTVSFLKSNHYHVCSSDVERMIEYGRTILYVENNMVYALYDLNHINNISYKRNMLLSSII